MIDLQGGWIVAWFRENQLGNIEVGDAAEVVLDVLPGRVWPARVVSFAGGIDTVNQAAPPGGLVDTPPQNSWMNEPQRFAVRLDFDPPDSVPRGVRLGSQATVMVYTEEAGLAAAALEAPHPRPRADVLCLLTPASAPQILRVALVTPLVYGVAVWMGAALPFVAAMLFATLALKMPAPPPFASVVLLALLLVLLPLGFASIAGVLNQYPYLMVGFVGLVLFHAFRLQAVPKTALIGVLLQTFAIMLPIVTGQSEQAGGVVSGAFALNGVLAVAGLYLAFALFPARRVAARAAPPPPPGDPLERTRNAAVAALVMLPAFTLLLAFNLSSAMRVLFTIAIVLVSLSRRDVRETGVESVLSAVMAGAVAVAFSVLYTFWPQPGAALLAMAFLGLLVVPYAFKGRHRGAVALAVPLVWVLLGTAEGSTLSKTLEWCLYSIVGVLYAVWARALILAMLGWRDGSQSAAEPSFDRNWGRRSSGWTHQLTTGIALHAGIRRRAFSRHRARSSKSGCELPDDATDQDCDVERAERRLERGADLRNRCRRRDVAVADGGHRYDAEIEHLRVEVPAFREAERSGMRAFQSGETAERTRRRSRNSRRSRRPGCRRVDVAVADELGEGRDERAEDDDQGQDRERALEIGDAEDVEDLEHERRQQERHRPARRPGGRCARRRSRRQISA